MLIDCVNLKPFLIFLQPNLPSPSPTVSAARKFTKYSDEPYNLLTEAAFRGVPVEVFVSPYAIRHLMYGGLVES